MSITLNHISYSYENTGNGHSGRVVLDDVNLTFEQDEFTAIIGPTGSGKSTLLQHLNCLLRATKGEVLYDGMNVCDDKFDRKSLRANVGMVFQYPEYQLFETTVLDDVAFGPKNLGMSPEEAEERAGECLKLVGIDEANFDSSPFELSGGQKRRVAIAGVIAMAPRYLVLDEPAAGLDPKGRRDLMNLFKNLHDNAKIGIILVSHSMEDVAEYADRVIVLEKGHVKLDGTTREVFSHRDELVAMGLEVPQATSIAIKLKNRGWNLPDGLITIDELRDAIIERVSGVCSER